MLAIVGWIEKCSDKDETFYCDRHNEILVILFILKFICV